MTAPRVNVLFWPGVLGCVAAGLAYTSVPTVAWLSSLAVVLLVPALVASRAGAGDSLERLAFAYGGLALSCWSLWVAGVTVGLDRATTLAAPLLASLAIAAVDIWRTPESGSEPRFGPASRGQRAAVMATSLVMAVLVVIPFLVYGWTRADGVHRMGMTDWYKHLVVTTALSADIRLPPANPFLITDAAAPYYYGFHLIAGSVQRGAHGVGSPYVMLLALTVATAAALPVVLFVVARGLFGDASLAARAAVGGTLLAGFDVVPWVLAAMREAVVRWPLGRGLAAARAIVPSSHLNFWIHHNERQFNQPYMATIWAPHHVSAVLLSLLLVHVAGRRRSRLGAAWAGQDCTTAVMLAALPAMSAYVALAFVVAVAAVVVLAAWRARCPPWRTEACRAWARVGVPAALLSAPVVLALAGSEGGQLTIAVSAAGGWMNGAFWTAVVGDRPIARLLDSPAVYLVQFGLVGVLGVRGLVRRIRQRTLTDRQRDAATIAAAIAVLVTVVRPPMGSPNNLFARPMLVVWMVLACFAAAEWAEPGRRWLRAAALTVSVAGTALAVAGATAEGALFWPTRPDVVGAAHWINGHAPPDAIVADTSAQPGLGYWLWRRTVVSDRRLAQLFGATASQYADATERLRDASDAPSSLAAWQRFKDLRADVVLMDAPVPAWAQPPCFRLVDTSETLVVLTRAPGCPGAP